MINFAAFNLPTKASENPRQTDPAERCNQWSDLIDETADAYLEDLPVELFSYIAQCASLDSVLNLRLVSRTICHKVTVEKFRQRFHSLEIEVSKWSLQSFAQVTRKASSAPTSSMSRSLAWHTTCKIYITKLQIVSAIGAKLIYSHMKHGTIWTRK
jgi:hypothetical protein